MSDGLIYLDFFIQVFTHALAWVLAVIVALVLTYCAAAIAFRLYCQWLTFWGSR